MWAKRYSNRNNNFGFFDSDDDEDWNLPDETYVVHVSSNVAFIIIIIIVTGLLAQLLGWRTSPDLRLIYG